MQSERLIEIARRTFDTPHFRGIEFIEVEAKSIVNRVPGNFLPFNWTINPYRGCSHACAYCFARVTHTYMDMNAGRDFESKIVVKINAPELLRAELASRRWRRVVAEARASGKDAHHIALGTGTDPYQRAEGRYRLMPGIIEALAAHANPFSILTKGTLILRDLELIAAAAEVTDVSTALSVPTVDEEVWRRTEPGTPHPRKRLEAVAALNDAGVPCGVMVAPVLPGISDGRRQLAEVVEAAVRAGATHVTPILLHLRPVVREEYMAWLTAEFPELVGRYEATYARSYAPAADRRALGGQVRGLVRRAGGIKPRATVAERFARRRRDEEMRPEPVDDGGADRRAARRPAGTQLRLL